MAEHPKDKYGRARVFLKGNNEIKGLSLLFGYLLQMFIIDKMIKKRKSPYNDH